MTKSAGTTNRLGDLLASRRATPLILASAALLTAGSLAGGIVRGDDSLQLLKARGALAAGLAERLNLFNFVPGTPAGNARWLDLGMVPWFARPDLRLAFFRPISSLSAFFDYTVLAGAPWILHLENVALYTALVALVLAAYRRVLPPPLAALSALLYAVDDAHTFPVSWLANRNSLFATIFAVAGLIAHDRWRRDAWRLGALLGPLAFSAGLLSGEFALAALAYLVAYALTLDPNPSWRRRAASLLPYVTVVVGWGWSYRHLGYGARGSGVYLDPVASPLRFAAAAPQRLAALFLSQAALPPADVSAYVALPARVAIAAVAALVLLFLVRTLGAEVRRDPVLRFFAIGATLAAVPTLATVPSDRLLMLVGFGAFGVIGSVLGDLRIPPDGSAARRALRRTWLAIHLVVAPLLLALGNLVPGVMGKLGEEAVAGPRLDARVATQLLVIANVPNIYAIQPVLFPPDDRAPRPGRLRTLATTANAVSLRREDAHAVAIEILPGPDADTYDDLFRDAQHPLRAGESFQTPGMRVEVSSVDGRGRALSFRALFDDDLGSPSVRWLAWSHGKMVDLATPAVGETVIVGPG